MASSHGRYDRAGRASEQPNLTVFLQRSSNSQTMPNTACKPPSSSTTWRASRKLAEAQRRRRLWAIFPTSRTSSRSYLRVMSLGHRKLVGIVRKDYAAAYWLTALQPACDRSVSRRMLIMVRALSFVVLQIPHNFDDFAFSFPPTTFETKLSSTSLQTVVDVRLGSRYGAMSLL